MDTTVPGIRFDQQGVCNFCHVHDKMDHEHPIGKEGELYLQHLSKKIKNKARGKKYDCIIGLSGGRDSCYTLHLTVTQLKLNPLAVYFSDGFSNPIALENMKKICARLNIDFERIDADWEESKDIKRAYLYASTPDMGVSTDIGIAASLYSIAAREGLKDIIIGQSFRTEGIAPLSWYFMDGKYMKSVHTMFGKGKLKAWHPHKAGFHLDLKQIFYYAIIKGIRTTPILYHTDYVRKNVDELLESEYQWKSPGAHYFDDLYQALIAHLLREKFKINRRIFNYSALVRSGQSTREEALHRASLPHHIEVPEVITACLEKLEVTKEEYDKIMKLPIRSFRDYHNNYTFIRIMRFPIWVACKLNIIPSSAYDKYFNCGK
jgi:hypothetical protein